MAKQAHFRLFTIPSNLPPQKQAEVTDMKSNQGYWKRQVYMLSSIGLFYILILAFFAIPLLGTFVVILIQGAIDFRYLILATGCMGFIGLVLFIVSSVRKFFRKMQTDGVVVSEDVRRHLLSGNPVEISFLNGLLAFKSGKQTSDESIALTDGSPLLLPYETGNNPVADVLDQLRKLSALKDSGAIDTDEYNLLKTMIIKSSTTSYAEKKGKLQ